MPGPLTPLCDDMAFFGLYCRQVGRYKVWGPYGQCDGIHFPQHTCMLKNNTGKLIVYEVRAPRLCTQFDSLLEAPFNSVFFFFPFLFCLHVFRPIFYPPPAASLCNFRPLVHAIDGCASDPLALSAEKKKEDTISCKSPCACDLLCVSASCERLERGWGERMCLREWKRRQIQRV